MPTAVTHAAFVLDRVDHLGSLVHFGQRLLRTARRGRQHRQSLLIVEKWLSEQSTRLHGVGLDAPTLPEALLRDASDASAMLYLLLEERRPVRRRDTFSPRIVKAALDSVEPDFVPTLLADLRRREATNPDFANELDRARRRTEQVARDLDSVRTRVAAEIATELGDGEELPSVLRQDNPVGPIVGGLVLLCLIFIYTSWLNDVEDKGDGDDDGDTA